MNRSHSIQHEEEDEEKDYQRSDTSGIHFSQSRDQSRDISNVSYENDTPDRASKYKDKEKYKEKEKDTIINSAQAKQSFNEYEHSPTKVNSIKNNNNSSNLNSHSPYMLEGVERNTKLNSANIDVVDNYDLEKSLNSRSMKSDFSHSQSQGHMSMSQSQSHSMSHTQSNKSSGNKIKTKYADNTSFENLLKEKKKKLHLNIDSTDRNTSSNDNTSEFVGIKKLHENFEDSGNRNDFDNDRERGKVRNNQILGFDDLDSDRYELSKNDDKYNKRYSQRHLQQELNSVDRVEMQNSTFEKKDKSHSVSGVYMVDLIPGYDPNSMPTNSNIITNITNTNTSQTNFDNHPHSNNNFSTLSLNEHSTGYDHVQLSYKNPKVTPLDFKSLKNEVLSPEDYDITHKSTYKNEYDRSANKSEYEEKLDYSPFETNRFDLDRNNSEHKSNNLNNINNINNQNNYNSANIKYNESLKNINSQYENQTLLNYDKELHYDGAQNQHKKYTSSVRQSVESLNSYHTNSREHIPIERKTLTNKDEVEIDYNELSDQDRLQRKPHNEILYSAYSKLDSKEKHSQEIDAELGTVSSRHNRGLDLEDLKVSGDKNKNDLNLNGLSSHDNLEQMVYNYESHKRSQRGLSFHNQLISPSTENDRDRDRDNEDRDNTNAQHIYYDSHESNNMKNNKNPINQLNYIHTLQSTNKSVNFKDSKEFSNLNRDKESFPLDSKAEGKEKGKQEKDDLNINLNNLNIDNIRLDHTNFNPNYSTSSNYHLLNSNVYHSGAGSVSGQTDRLQAWKATKQKTKALLESHPDSYQVRFSNLVGRLTMQYLKKDDSAVSKNNPSLTFQLKKNKPSSVVYNPSNPVIQSFYNDYKNVNETKLNSSLKNTNSDMYLKISTNNNNNNNINSNNINSNIFK